MNNTTKRAKKHCRPRGNKLLTNSELNKIRSFLPREWRKVIAESNDSLTLRQVTEVFNQRTTKPDINIKVWEPIGKMLTTINQQTLAVKVDQVLSFYRSLYNVIQK